MDNVIVNVKSEMLNLDSRVIFEYSKVIGDLDYNNIKILEFNDGDRTVHFVFYGSDFIAFNRVNFKDGFEYNYDNEYVCIGENLNSKIQKIPNVAKTRDILKIDDIEMIIYDMEEYILLLSKNSTRILKVNFGDILSDFDFVVNSECLDNVKDRVNEISFEEEEKLKEERSFKNRFNRFKEFMVKSVLEPIKFVKEKLFRSDEVKLLNEGRHSVFNK